MEDAEKAILQRQIDAELKNALKSEERKKKQKRKLSDKDKTEPPKKKEKKSTSIPLTVEDLKLIRERFYTVPVYLPLLDKLALYSGLTNEALAFNAYPILLSAAIKKDGKSVPQDYILGVSKPPIIFTVLRDIFKILYPERNPMDCINWDVYKFNRAFYGFKTEKASYNQDLLQLSMAETKPFGGPRDPSNIHWLEENKLKRFVKTISLEEYFKDKDIKKIKNPEIPTTAKPWPANYLNQINEKVEALKKSLLLAEEKAEGALRKKEIADAIKNLKETSEDTSDDDESE